MTDNYEDIVNRVQTFLLEETSYKSGEDLASGVIATAQALVRLSVTLIKLSNNNNEVIDWVQGLLDMTSESIKEMIEDD